MKRILTLLFVVGALNTGYSQSFEILEHELEVSGPETEFDLRGYSFVRNISADTIFTWKRITNAFSTPVWTSSICDKVTCWAVEVDRNSFILSVGDTSIMNAYVYLSNTAGNGIVRLAVWAGSDSSAADTITYYFATWPTSVSKYGTGKALNVYPNPAKSQLTLDFESTVPVRVEIYDALGKKVATYDHNESIASHDVSSLREGLYMIKVYEDAKVYTRTFQKIGG